VSEEGEAAQHDPGAQHARADREDQELEQGPLHVWELECVEHHRSSAV